MKIKAFGLMCAFSLLTASVWADEAEVTIDVIEEEKAEPEQLMNRIELPAEASIEVRENAEFGLETANDAREKGRRKGAEAAAEYRDFINLGREIPLPPGLEGNDFEKPGPQTPQPPVAPGTP